MDGSASELLRLEQVSVRFGAVQALHDIDLSIRAGERVALIGANGCGKTTLLRVLHGVVAHSGRRLRAPSDGRRRAGSEHGLPAPVHAAPERAEQPAPGALAAPACRARTGTNVPARRCSASAWPGWPTDRRAPCPAGSSSVSRWRAPGSLRPDILFLDEPTASLDPHAKKEVEALLAGFAAEATTLVMSTHNLGQVKRLASRVDLPRSRPHPRRSADRTILCRARRR